MAQPTDQCTIHSITVVTLQVSWLPETMVLLARLPAVLHQHTNFLSFNDIACNRQPASQCDPVGLLPLMLADSHLIS